jgi:hypothetical protein
MITNGEIVNNLIKQYGVVETADRHILGRAEESRYNSRKLRLEPSSSKR